MTIYQHASFDAQAAGLNATSKINPAVAKMVAAWENKNAKRAMQGSGLALMAMSLTACGGSSTTAVTPAATTTTTTTTTAATSNAAVPLTAGPDTLVGDANNDTFNSLVDGLLEAGDNITGGAGTADKLVIRDYDTSAGTFTMSGVEIIDINFATTAQTLDLEDVTGVTSLIIDSSVAANTVANVAATTSLTLANISAGVTNIDITFVDGAFDPLLNTYSLTLNDIDDALTLSLDSFGTDVEAIDTLNINVGSNNNAGAITFDVEGQSAASVIITGSASTTLTGLDGTTLDASAATGAITLSGLGAAAMTVTGGSAADVFDFGATLTSADTVVGGLGNDTLILSTTTGAIIGTGAAANVLNVSGIEILRLDTALTAAITIDADRLTGLTTIDLDGAGTAGETVTITDLANASELRVSAAQVATVSIDLAANTASDTFTLTFDGAGITLADVDTSNAFINTFNIVSSGTGANIITNASGVTVSQIIVTGAQDLDVNNNALAANVTDFDASGATGDVDVLMGNVATNVTGGTGADILSGGTAADVINGGAGIDVIDGNAGADTIDGGAGADTITGAAGLNTLTGGAGADTFVIEAVTDDNTMTDFTAGAGGDLLQFANDLHVQGASVSVETGAQVIQLAAKGVATSATATIRVVTDANILTVAADSTFANIETDFDTLIGTGDTFLTLTTGATTDLITVIIDGDDGNSYVFTLDNTTGATSIATGDDIQLTAVLEGVDTADLVAANFVA